MTRNEVLVGLDPSPAGQAALDWAARYARFTYTDLRALHILTWAFDSPAWSVGYETPYGLDGTSQAEIETTETLFAALEPDPDWSLSHLWGVVGPALVEEAYQAQLLVIGTGLHSPLARALFGSTSRYCLRHAPCPVVAVPTRPQPGQHRNGSRAGHRQTRDRDAA
jgi:nucleotide-binding universal stress UspA family protein